MPSTPQTQSFNRKSITLFTKCDELAKLEDTEIVLLIRRKAKISIYQTNDFWLSQEDINRAYPIPRWIQPKDLQEISEKRKRRKADFRGKAFNGKELATETKNKSADVKASFRFGLANAV